MNWEIVTSMFVSVIGAFGGVEFFKWFWTRDQTKEKAEIEALRETIKTLQEAIRIKHDNNEWLQQQMQAKEERFADQTQHVRKLNSEVLDLTNKLAEERMAHKFDECQDKKCPFREPPKPYTPARAGLTREAYFEGGQTPHCGSDAASESNI